MEASHFQITAVYAGILALMLVMLGILVVKNRYRAKVGLFDGGDEQLGQAIRVHGNFAEYLPVHRIGSFIVWGRSWLLEDCSTPMGSITTEAFRSVEDMVLSRRFLSSSWAA